jgi:hypothetical protein
MDCVAKRQWKMRDVSAVLSGRILFWELNPGTMCRADFRLSRWDERRAKIILRLTFVAIGVSIPNTAAKP